MLERVKHIDVLVAAQLPTDEFAVVHSAWLALMGLRTNGDLDVILSAGLRKTLFPDRDENRHWGLPGPLERRIRFQPAKSPYGSFYGASDIDDVIRRHCVVIDGIKFIEPRFYFMFKKHRMDMLSARKAGRPLWQRLAGPLNSVNRALERKIQKDAADFGRIARFLDDSGPEKTGLAQLGDDVWDRQERSWLPATLARR